MKKTVASLLTLSALLTLAGCSSSAPVETTPEVVVPQETNSQVVGNASWEMYTDTTGTVSFSYPKTRKLSIEKESDSNVFTLTSGSYELIMTEYNNPSDAQCAHPILSGLDLSLFKKMQINGIDMMRDTEDNQGDCSSNNDELGAGILLSVYYATGTDINSDPNKELITTSSCLDTGKRVEINYRIGTSKENEKTCAYDQTIVEEMDAIASTLKW